MKVAIIHDWLDKRGGAENVLEILLQIYPQAELFTLVNFSDAKDFAFLKNTKITTSFIQKLPLAKKHFRKYIALFPLAIESFNLKKYDLIISDSHAVAKGVKTKKGQIHLCYIHSPMRYAWDMRTEYLTLANLNHGLKGKLTNLILDYLKYWDKKTAPRVTKYFANSSFIKKRVKNCYGLKAEILYPPADTKFFKPSRIINKQNYFFTYARHESYKRIDLIIKTFNQLPNEKLLIAGTGNETENLKKLAGPNIKFLGKIPKTQLGERLQQARAFIYAAREDFGVVMVEALAAATPVIAFGVGGAVDIVQKNCGVLYPEQNVLSLKNALQEFTKKEKTFKSEILLKEAAKYSEQNFKDAFKKICDSYLNK